MPIHVAWVALHGICNHRWVVNGIHAVSHLSRHRRRSIRRVISKVLVPLPLIRDAVLLGPVAKVTTVIATARGADWNDWAPFTTMCGPCKGLDLKFQSRPACLVLTDRVLQRHTELVLRAHRHAVHGEEPITNPEATRSSHRVEDLVHLQLVDRQADLATLEQPWHDKGLRAVVRPVPAQRVRKICLLSRAILEHSSIFSNVVGRRDAVDAVWQEVIAERQGSV
mmetsp:Transcript_130317/g.325016  ORF Transcript_130317/g.325016 Transcript_130317/m.325016 type:complete len:224 (+) Transcript_130317:449-1120(+)